jgi:hypothetical protein
MEPGTTPFPANDPPILIAHVVVDFGRQPFAVYPVLSIFAASRKPIFVARRYIVVVRLEAVPLEASERLPAVVERLAGLRERHAANVCGTDEPAG